MATLEDIKRVKHELKAALKLAEKSGSGFHSAAYIATCDKYDEACSLAGYCYQVDCYARTDWCAYCDAHCENPDHLPHADN